MSAQKISTFPDSTQVPKCDARIITAVRGIDERAEHGVLLDRVAEHDNVDRNIILLELLREAHHAALVRGGALQRRADKYEDALSKVLVLPVLERELRDVDRGGDVDFAADFARGGV